MDATLEIVKRYSAYVTYWVSEPDNGIYDAMNKGIKKAAGEWVYIMGSDDILYDKEVLSKIFTDKDNLKSEIIYGNVIFKHSGKKWLGKFNFEKLQHNNICHQAIFFKRKVFDMLGLYDNRYRILSDWEFNFRWFTDRRIKKKYVGDVIAVYNELGTSSRQPDLVFNENFAKIVQQAFFRLSLAEKIFYILKRKISAIIRCLKCLIKKVSKRIIKAVIPSFIKARLNSLFHKPRLTMIGLSLSSQCNADCIFCPSDRGKRIKQKMMSFSCVEKIIKEISAEDFRKYHNVSCISVGENGEPFLNKDIIEILRFIKLRLPQVKVHIFSNFSLFTADKAEIILKEKLIDTFGCNIDGYTNFNYFNIKRLELEKTKQNIINFLEIRNKLNSNASLHIYVLTLHNYIHSVYNALGFYPAKLSDRTLMSAPDDFMLIKEQFERIFDLTKDEISRSSVFKWAEREKINTKKLDYNKYTCPRLGMVETAAFIAPDGTWYACCLDSNNELVLGNIIQQSINDIFFSKRRKKILKLLKNKKFAKIGGPCKTVNCCYE